MQNPRSPLQLCLAVLQWTLLAGLSAAFSACDDEDIERTKAFYLLQQEMLLRRSETQRPVLVFHGTRSDLIRRASPRIPSNTPLTMRHPGAQRYIQHQLEKFGSDRAGSLRDQYGPGLYASTDPATAVQFADGESVFVIRLAQGFRFLDLRREWNETTRIERRLLLDLGCEDQQTWSDALIHCRSIVKPLFRQMGIQGLMASYGAFPLRYCTSQEGLRPMMVLISNDLPSFAVRLISPDPRDLEGSSHPELRRRLQFLQRETLRGKNQIALRDPNPAFAQTAKTWAGENLLGCQDKYFEDLDPSETLGFDFDFNHEDALVPLANWSKLHQQADALSAQADALGLSIWQFQASILSQHGIHLNLLAGRTPQGLQASRWLEHLIDPTSAGLAFSFARPESFLDVWRQLTGRSTALRETVHSIRLSKSPLALVSGALLQPTQDPAFYPFPERLSAFNELRSSWTEREELRLRAQSRWIQCESEVPRQLPPRLAENFFNRHCPNHWSWAHGLAERSAFWRQTRSSMRAGTLDGAWYRNACWPLVQREISATQIQPAACLMLEQPVPENLSDHTDSLIFRLSQLQPFDQNDYAAVDQVLSISQELRLLAPLREMSADFTRFVTLEAFSSLGWRFPIAMPHDEALASLSSRQLSLHLARQTRWLYRKLDQCVTTRAQNQPSSERECREITRRP